MGNNGGHAAGRHFVLSAPSVAASQTRCALRRDGPIKGWEHLIIERGPDLAKGAGLSQLLPVEIGAPWAFAWHGGHWCGGWLWRLQRGVSVCFGGFLAYRVYSPTMGTTLISSLKPYPDRRLDRRYQRTFCRSRWVKPGNRWVTIESGAVQLRCGWSSRAAWG